jgi:succinate-acetate transporter protein
LVESNPHNVFAVMGFTFAICTVYLHKHTFVVINHKQWPYLDLNVTSKALAISELVLIITISILGGLFWFMDVVIAEYIFIALILVDKYVKIKILEKSGLLNTDGATLKYVYYSLPNRENSGAYITNEFNF